MKQISLFSDSTLGLEALAKSKNLILSTIGIQLKKRIFWDDKFSYIKFRKR